MSGVAVKSTSEKSDGSRKLAVLAALLLLGIGGGAVGRKLLRAPSTPQPYQPYAARTASPFQSTGFTADVAAAWSRLLDVLKMPGAQGFSYDRFATLLLGHDEPAAVAFFKDYSASPNLLRTWNEFRARRNENGVDAYWLAQKLSKSGEFAGLLNKHAQDPAFMAFGDKVTKELSSAVLQSGAAGVTKGKEVAAADKFALANDSDQGMKAPAEQDPGAAGYGLRKMDKLQDVSGTTDVRKFESLFTKATLSSAQRSVVINSLLKGSSIQVACSNAHAGAQCLDAYKKCQADPSCGKSLNSPAGYGSLGTANTPGATSAAAPAGMAASPAGVPSAPSAAPSAAAGGGGQVMKNLGGGTAVVGQTQAAGVKYIYAGGNAKNQGSSQ
ncbi:MAG: hypothetical protein NTX64_06435 [Elusimicrobia bacterium]|nr:hypothetical protein [Elusimicrobiota bacterium]